MKRRTSYPMLGALLLTGAACSSDPGVDRPDPGRTDPPPTQNPPRNVEPIPGGGVSARPVADAFTVFATDSEGLPVAGAKVVLEGPAGPLANGTTDADGRWDFEGGGLAPPLVVHVFEEDVPFQSFAGVRGDVLTVVLEAEPEVEAPGAVAEIVGTLEGWDSMPTATDGLVRVAEVRSFGSSALSRPAQLPREGTVTPDDPDGFPTSMAVDGVAPFPQWHGFRLRSDPRAVGLVAYGWTFDAEKAEAHEPTRLGLTLDLELGEGQVRDGVELELAHALDVQISLQGPSSDLLRRTLSFGIELPEKGWVVPLASGDANEAFYRTARAPRLQGSFEGARYAYGVRLASEATVRGRPAREVVATRFSALTAVDMGDVVDAPGRPGLSARTLSAVAPQGAELGRLDLRSADGELKWTVWLLDAVTGEVELPAAPEGHDDPLAAPELELEMTAFDLGEVPAALELERLVPQSLSVHRVFVTTGAP